MIAFSTFILFLANLRQKWMIAFSSQSVAKQEALHFSTSRLSFCFQPKLYQTTMLAFSTFIQFPGKCRKGGSIAFSTFTLFPANV